MLVWLLYLLVLVVLSAAFVVGFGMLFGRGSARRRLGDSDFDAAAMVDGNISFDLAPRGYRQDQVDAVIAELKERLNRQSAR